MGELVTVFQSEDIVAISLAKGLLEQAEIPYIVKNEAVQELFGSGRMGIGYNPVVGAIQIQVDRHYEHSASKLLEELGHKESGEIVHKASGQEVKRGMSLERSLYRALICLILLVVFIRLTRQWLVGVIVLSLVCVCCG